MNQMLVISICVLGLGFGSVFTKELEERQNQFMDLLIRGEYVDKTQLMEVLMEMPRRMLITAPRGWGKSTNLDMIRKFVELEVDEEGFPRSKASTLRLPVNDTGNYVLFSSNRLAITRHKYTMRRFFGKFPVIYVDFKSVFKITNSDNAVFCFRDVVHRAYKEYEYLRKSGKLTSKEKRLLMAWSHDRDYEKFYGQDVTNSLYKLSRLLYRHFGRKAFVLIDNYDHPSTNAMFEVKDHKELNRITMFNMGIISKLISVDNDYIRKAVITGISYVMVAGIHEVDNLSSYRFLENHKLVEYFGLTKKEVQKLFQGPGSKIDQAFAMKISHSFYGGYTSLRGDSVYNMRSVIEFVESGEIRRYKSLTGIFQNMKQLFKIQVIRENIECLIKGCVFNVNINENINVSDIVGLRNFVIIRKTEERFNINLVLYFLLEQGYLAYGSSESDNSTHSLKIPNLEIKTMFALKLKEYYDGIYRLDKSLIRKCTSFFDSFSPSSTSNQIQLQRTLYFFFRSLEEFIWKTKSHFRKLCLFDIPRMLFSVMYQINVKGNSGAFVTINEAEEGLNVVVSKEKITFLLALRCNQTSSAALQHLLDIKDNMVDVKKIMFIGLGMDTDLHPSISCLSNNKNVSQAIHIPAL